MEVSRDKDDIFGQVDCLKSGMCYSSLGDGCVHSFQWVWKWRQNNNRMNATLPEQWHYTMIKKHERLNAFLCNDLKSIHYSYPFTGIRVET